MTANIIKELNIGNRNFQVSIQVFPQTKEEYIAIKNSQNGIATDNERFLIDNLLDFTLQAKNYSAIDLINQKGEIFILKAFLN